MKERDYGIDLLKIFAMFLIVVLHVLGQGGVLSACGTRGVRGFLGWTLEAGAFCAVNCYALASGYVGWNVRHRYSGIIALWLRVLFYSVGITYITIFINSGWVPEESFLNAFIPVMSGTYWYFTAYVLLFFLMPLLNKVIRSMEQSELKFALLSLLGFLAVSQLVFDQNFHMNYGYSVWWLMILYLVGGYIGRYNAFSEISRKQALIGFFGIMLFCALWKFLFLGIAGLFEPEGAMETFFTSLSGRLIKFNSITIVAEAVLLLLVFRKLTFSDNGKEVLKFVTPLAFSVYIIHVHPVIWSSFLKSRFTVLAKLPAPVMILAVLGCAALIFLVCLIVDGVRQFLFNKIRYSTLGEEVVDRLPEWISQR